MEITEKGGVGEGETERCVSWGVAGWINKNMKSTQKGKWLFMVPK